MARNSAVAWRQLIGIGNHRNHHLRSAYRLLHSNSAKTLNSIPNDSAPPLPIPSTPFSKASSLFSNKLLSPPCRFLSTSSSPASGPSNVVIIKSEEGFKSEFSKVKDGSLPAIFYFTAVWCGPCRLISPIIGQLSQKYPHVTTYKIDIDEEDLGKTLSELNITAVPTFHFFQNGKRAAEVVGADVERLKSTMEKLY